MIEEAVARAIDSGSMLYNRKSNCPQGERDAELRFLFKLAGQAPDGAAVECGVYRGGAFACWTMAREGRGNLYANDGKGRPSLYRCIEGYGIDATVLIMPAKDVPAVIDEDVAFCFIDAEHGEGGITEDIKVWPAKIMPGGILAFHDYDVWKPNVVVKREVDRWQAKAQWYCLGSVGSTIAFRRPA